MFRELFDRDPLYKVKAYDGMKETLTELKKEGSGSGGLFQQTARRGGKGGGSCLWKRILSGDPGAGGTAAQKPAPDGAWEVARRLGVLPEECVYLGDTNTDMQQVRSRNVYGGRTLGIS